MYGKQVRRLSPSLLAVVAALSFAVAVSSISAKEKIRFSVELRAVQVPSPMPGVVRVEFELRNTGSKNIRGCLGPTWNWSEVDSPKNGMEVISSHSTQEFDLDLPFSGLSQLRSRS